MQRLRECAHQTYYVYTRCTKQNLLRRKLVLIKHCESSVNGNHTNDSLFRVLLGAWNPMRAIFYSTLLYYSLLPPPPRNLRSESNSLISTFHWEYIILMLGRDVTPSCTWMRNFTFLFGPKHRYRVYTCPSKFSHRKSLYKGYIYIFFLQIDFDTVCSLNNCILNKKTIFWNATEMVYSFTFIMGHSYSDVNTQLEPAYQSQIYLFILFFWVRKKKEKRSHENCDYKVNSASLLCVSTDSYLGCHEYVVAIATRLCHSTTRVCIVYTIIFNLDFETKTHTDIELFLSII